MVEWKELDDVFRPDVLFGYELNNLLKRSASETLVLVEKKVLDSIFIAAYGERQEIGGILLGTAHTLPSSKCHVTHVKKSAVGRGSDGSPVHLQFTSGSWEAIRAEIVGSTDTIVGWFHTHPRLGVFMSGTDRRTQRNFFSQPWQVSLVVDPSSQDIGFFAGEASEQVRHILLQD